MPRAADGSYSLPAGTAAVSGQPASSSNVNSRFNDLEADANTARPVTAGGTGSTTAGGARINLGLVIGTNVQAQNATLTSIAALGTAANKIAYTTGVDTWAEASATTAGLALLAGADAAAQRTSLGLGAAALANYTPVQQSGGIGQSGNKLYIGWSTTGLKLTVDTTDNGHIWTDSIAAQTFATSGYQKLPSGLILQWGTTSIAAGTGFTGFTFTLPTAFPTGALMAWGLMQDNGSLPGGATLYTAAGTTTTQGYTLYNGNALHTFIVNCFVIGY